MHRRRSHWRSTLVTLSTLAAACGDSTGPDALLELDTDAAMEDYATLDAVLGAAELSGFQALDGRTPFGGGPAAVDAVAGMEAPDSGDGGRALALALFGRLQRTASTDGGPLRAPLISETHRGATFVYDPTADEYVVDPDRDGAPATGVRFVLYEVDDAGIPIPASERGWADLVDEGDASGEDVALRLTVVDGGVTVLEYATTLTGAEGEGRLTVAGFLQGEGARLDFDIAAHGRRVEGVERVDLDFELRVDARDFAIVGSVQGVDEDGDGDGAIDITVKHRTVSLRVDVAETAGVVAGTIHLNGDVFATVSGSEDDPVFQRPDGTPLRIGERLVLHRMFDTVEDVFDLLEDLLDPVDELVILGIIL